MSNNQIMGVVPSPADDRDYKYFIPKGWVPKQSNFLTVPRLYDQLQVNSCVPHGINHQIQSHTKEFSSGPVWDISRYALYVMTLMAEDRLGSEGGLYTRDAYKVAMAKGTLTESDVHYVNEEPTADLHHNHYFLADNAGKKINEYQLVHPPTDDGINTTPDSTKDKICSAIDEGFAVTVALQVSGDIYSMSGDWRTHQYRKVQPSVESVGGHLMCVTGYDRAANRFYVANSWGEDWGDDGYGGFPMDDLVASPFFEAYVIREFAGEGSHAEAGFYFNEQNAYRADVTLTVPDELVGTTTKLWVGAQLPDGTLMMKAPYFSLGLRGTPTPNRPLTVEDISGYQNARGGGYDQWLLLADADGPIHSEFPLEKHNRIKVFDWTWLPDIAGTKIYMEYGDTFNINEVEHVMTVTG